MATSADDKEQEIPPQPSTSLEIKDDALGKEFDVITKLMVSGVPHIVEEIFTRIGIQSLCTAERVCHGWNSFIAYQPLWKKLIKNKVNGDPVWKGLFERRGWQKYLSQDAPSGEPIPNSFYLKLCQIAYKDIHNIVHIIHLVEKMWNMETGEMLGRLDQNYCWVWSLRFNSDTMVTGSTDGLVVLWDYSPGVIDMRGILLGHETDVWGVDLNEKYIVSCSGDGSVMVWDPLTGSTTHELIGHDRWVRCLQLHGHHVVSGSHDSTVRLWDVETGKCLRVLDGHDDEEIKSVGFDGKRIISGDEEGIIKVWDYQAALDPTSSDDSLCLVTLDEHTRHVFGIKFDDFQLISVSADKTILIWDFLDPVPPQL